MKPVCKKCGHRTFALVKAKGLCKDCLGEWILRYRLEQIKRLQGK